MKRMRRKTFGVSRRWSAGLLCLCMVLSMWSGMGLVRALAADTVGTQPTQYIVDGTRLADPDTMDDYQNQLLTQANGSRYAGRVWTDKTVFAYGDQARKSSGTDPSHFDGKNTITLDMETDGYKGEVKFNADFAHVFSALASSQVVNEYPPSPIDMVLVLDVSSSMSAVTSPAVEPYKTLASQNAIKHTRFLNLIYSADRVITQLMENNPENRVSVVIYDRRATVIMPLAHYEANTLPVSQISRDNKVETM